MTIQRSITVGSVTVEFTDYIAWQPGSYIQFDSGQLNLLESQPNLFAQSYVPKMALRDTGPALARDSRRGLVQAHSALPNRRKGRVNFKAHGI